jgi:hypothetical protein
MLRSFVRFLAIDIPSLSVRAQTKFARIVVDDGRFASRNRSNHLNVILPAPDADWSIAGRHAATNVSCGRSTIARHLNADKVMAHCSYWLETAGHCRTPKSLQRSTDWPCALFPARFN